MRSKAQILKTASTLKEFSSKIKVAEEGGVLTPETVKEIAEEIREVAEVATELAEEISEGVPAEGGEREERSEEPRQIEVAQDDEDDDKKKKEAADKEFDKGKDDEKEDHKEKLASLQNDLVKIKREATLAKLAPKYASLFPKNMHEAKMNEILTSKQPLNIVEAKIQEASDIITNKTMIKVASMTDSIFDLTDTSEEVNIAAKL